MSVKKWIALMLSLLLMIQTMPLTARAESALSMTADRFLVQINSNYEFVADLTDAGQIYHNDYEHTDYVYVSPGMQFAVWRDTIYFTGIGIKYGDTNIWWRWDYEPKNISAAVHEGTVPYSSETKTRLGNTFYYSYGGNNMNDALRHATVSISPNAVKGDYNRLTVCNGDSWDLTIPRGYRYARTGDPNRLHIYVAEQIALTYNLNYDGNGGGGIHATQIGYTTGTAGTSQRMKWLAGPTRENYRFDGWNTKPDGSGTRYTAGTEFRAMESLTLYAQWVPDYTVSFHGNGATAGSMRNQNFGFNEKKALTPNTFKREYTVTFHVNDGTGSTDSAKAVSTFNGWEDRGSIEYDHVSYSHTTVDIPFYVSTYGDLYTAFGYDKYALIEHYVNHGMEEGRSPKGNSPGLWPDRAEVSRMTTTAGYTVPLYANWTLGSVTLPNPTRDGFVFEGWYTDASGGTRVGGADDAYTPESNVTLYARWCAEHTVTACVNDDRGTASPAAQTVASGKDAAITFTADPGYRIDYIMDNDVRFDMAADDVTSYTYTISAVTTDHHVEAYMVEDAVSAPLYMYELVLDANVTDGSVSNMPDAPGITAWLEAPSYTFTWSGAPDRIGFDFVGWSTDPNDDSGSNVTSYTVEGQPAEKAVVTLYAIWREQQVTINYVALFGGAVSNSAETLYAISDTAQGSTAAASNGYKFVGWYDDPECTNAPITADPHLTPAKNHRNMYEAATYYAKFERLCGSLTITKSGSTDTNQTFIFCITGPNGFEMEVMIRGNNSVTVCDLPTGSYTVAEDNWSWRYNNNETITKTTVVTQGQTTTLAFENVKTNDKWFSALAWIRNIFGIGNANR